MPEVKLGIVAVSRDCFPISLSKKRLANVVKELKKIKITVTAAKTTVENETDAVKALSEMREAGVNALVVYLGNFGPEGPETLLAQKFVGPVMFCAAAEESGDDLINGRGDALCGLLNASYNLGLRGVMAYIPEYPVGDAGDTAKSIADFYKAAKVVVGVKKLKIFSFGPRPFDFLACNAPIAPLFDLGVEIQENSELDLFTSYEAHNGDARIEAVIKDMESELGAGNKQSGILPKLAQYELTLLDWAEKNKGASDHFVFANKCWPAFQTAFKFVPCYVNSRLTARGVPVACETDIYGALSEYMITLATDMPAALLDINNSVPKNMYEESKKQVGDYKLTDLFMGFHCGNTSSCYIDKAEMKYQLIMKRLIEPEKDADVTRGTLEGRIKESDITLFRLQGTADCALRSYIAEGEILNINPKSFGSIGVFAVKEMGRFYRHVLIAKRYPHHAGIAFAHAGKTLYDAVKLLGVCPCEINYNQPAGTLYPGENPFAR